MLQVKMVNATSKKGLLSVVFKLENRLPIINLQIIESDSYGLLLHPFYTLEDLKRRF